MLSDTGFRFDLGRLSLNFVATARYFGERPVERVPTAEHVARWFAQSGLVRAGEAPPLGESDRARFVALRDVLHRLVHDVVHGREPGAGDLVVVNAAAQRAHPPVPQLRHACGACWDVVTAQPPSAQQLLALVARDAIELIGGPDRLLMRECGAGTCDGIYVDRSRAFTRRWCSSTACGNHVRVKRFRHKAR